MELTKKQKSELLRTIFIDPIDRYDHIEPICKGVIVAFSDAMPDDLKKQIESNMNIGDTILYDRRWTDSTLFVTKHVAVRYEDIMQIVN